MNFDDFFREFSLVIAVAENSTAWQGLLVEIISLPKETQIIFCRSEGLNDYEKRLIDRARTRHRVLWLKTPSDLASQWNRGIQAAQGNFLWFLEDDSNISTTDLLRVLKAKEMIHSAVYIPRARSGFVLSRASLAWVGDFLYDPKRDPQQDFLERCLKHAVPIQPLSARMRYLRIPRPKKMDGWSKIKKLFTQRANPFR